VASHPRVSFALMYRRSWHSRRAGQRLRAS